MASVIKYGIMLTPGSLVEFLLPKLYVQMLKSTYNVKGPHGALKVNKGQGVVTHHSDNRSI